MQMEDQKVDWDWVQRITDKILQLGKIVEIYGEVRETEPLRNYFRNGELMYDELDTYDGKFTRREIFARYLLLRVVLDQGPDPIGVGKLLKEVATSLYRQEIRIFHKPLDFFNELKISIDDILEKHKSIKDIRAEKWAKENASSPSKYNLFFAQSLRGIVPINQVLDYTIHRWGVPLCVPLLLEKDLEKEKKESAQPLVDYIERFKSAEVMARQLKDHERYGLGSAIGDKACHLFAKLYVSVFKLVKKRVNDIGWTGISYELPFDSNAGRVLFRTGFLLQWASLEEYKKWNVIQKEKGKGHTNYIRVTNIRDKSTARLTPTQDYLILLRDYLKIAEHPQKVKIQHIPNLLLYKKIKKGEDASIADFDNGLMYVGTQFCFNRQNPRCEECPLRELCRGYNQDVALIRDYTT